jgi:hypothetical protein
MTYHLELVSSKEKLSISEDKWHKALNFAKENGWIPQGTVLDFEKELDLLWNDSHDRMYNLWMVLTSHNACCEWNGSYTEKEDQTVLDNDSYELMLSLEISDEFADIAAFISGVSFRILRL